MNREDLETAPLEELLEFYNANNSKKLKQFADRPTAVIKVGKTLDKLEAKAAKEAAAAAKAEAEANAVPLTPEEIAQKEAESKERRAAGTRSSWEREDVRAKRIARHGVEVDGVYYKSVGEAYRQLGLPLNKRIAHRIDLKIKGEDYEYINPATGQQYHWVIVPFRKVEPKPKAKKVKAEDAPATEAPAEAPTDAPVDEVMTAQIDEDSLQPSTDPFAAEAEQEA